MVGHHCALAWQILRYNKDSFMNLQIPCHILMPTFRKDGGATLKFTSTLELSQTEKMFLLEAGQRDEIGWMVWKPNKIQVPDLPTEQASEGEKSPSKRMKAILYVEWEQKGKQGTFDGYYRQRMDELCDKLKAQLD
jgi:hypothetical protein